MESELEQRVRQQAHALEAANAALAERSRVEEALRRSEERFRQVAESAGEFIWEVDADGLYLYASQAVEQILGYKPEEIVGKMYFYDLFTPETREEMKTAAFEVFASRQPFRAFLNLTVSKDGRIVALETSGLPILDGNRDFRGYRGADTDVTERKRAQEIENRLASDLEHSRDEIRALAASLMRAQEDERRRVSLDLHDHICHQLGSLASDIGKLAVGPLPSNVRAELEEIRARVLKTSQEAHDIAYHMHTAVLDDLGLVASLKDLCNQFSEHYPDIALDFEDSGPCTSIPGEVASCLYRVAEESLQNIAKHSRAKRVSVRLDIREEAVVLTIQDDGAGFDPEAVKAQGGLGLISVRERAHSVKGKLTITSQPGHGTQITLAIPFQVGNS